MSRNSRKRCVYILYALFLCGLARLSCHHFFSMHVKANSTFLPNWLFYQFFRDVARNLLRGSGQTGGLGDGSPQLVLGPEYGNPMRTPTGP